MKRNLSQCILFGSLWGIVEATFGHFLHTISLGIGWMFWFPIAFFFIQVTYSRTKSSHAVLATAFIAASLKCLNLFQAVRYDMVLNPAVAIILEALSAILVYSYQSRKNAESGVIYPMATYIIAISSLWRVLYICYVFFLPESLIAISPVVETTAFAKFLFFENIINLAVIGAAVCVYRLILVRIRPQRSKYQIFFEKFHITTPILSVIALFMAIVVQIIT